MTNNEQHLIQAFVLTDGNKLVVNDYCKDDKEFYKKMYAYYKVYSITYADVNHRTEKKGNKALTKTGEWVDIKKSKAYCKAGKQIWNGYHRDRRQYFFSSVELANYMFSIYKPYGATLQGRLMTVPFGIGIGKTFIEDDYKKIRWAF